MKTKVISYFVNPQYAENKAVTEIKHPELDSALNEGFEVQDIKHIPYADTSYVCIVIFTLVKKEV